MFAKQPDLRTGIHLDENGRRTDQENAQIGHAQVHQEDVRAVPHIFATEHHDRYLKRVKRNRQVGMPGISTAKVK